MLSKSPLFHLTIFVYPCCSFIFPENIFFIIYCFVCNFSFQDASVIKKAVAAKRVEIEKGLLGAKISDRIRQVTF